MSVARRILSNTVAQIISKILLAVLGLLSVKVLTNYLDENTYGNYVYTYEFLAFFGVIADLGIFTIAVKEMSEDEKNIPKLLGNILSLRTFLVVSAAFMAIIMIFFSPETQSPQVPIAVGIASLTMFVATINGTISSVLQTKLKMELASIGMVLGKILTVGLMAYVAFYGFPENTEVGFYLMFVSGLVGISLSLIFTSHFVRKFSPISYQFDYKLWKRILKESLPYGLALILNTIYFRLDSILIYNLRSSSELGIYGIAMKTLEQFVLLPLFFMNSVLPVLTRKIKEKSNSYKKIIKASFDFLAALSFPIVVGGFILATPIINIISSEHYLTDYSTGYLGSDLAFKILIFALLFQFLSVLFSFILISKSQQKKLLYINATCAILNLITNIIFIPHYGFVGAAITSVFCELFIFLATYFVAKRTLDFQLNLKNLLKIILSALLMGLTVYYLQTPIQKLFGLYGTILLIFLGGTIYISSLYFTNVINKELLQLLKKNDPQTPKNTN